MHILIVLFVVHMCGCHMSLDYYCKVLMCCSYHVEFCVVILYQLKYSVLSFVTISKMTYNVSSRMLNLTHSFTLSFV